MSGPFLAHSKSRDGSRDDTVADHLRSVASRAAEFASAFGAADEARLAAPPREPSRRMETRQVQVWVHKNSR